MFKNSRLIAIVATIGLTIPAVVYAGHDFDDVEDGHFYHDASSWAADNGITLGCVLDGSLFCGENPVTRGENITFAHRYDTNVVQPALDAVNAARSRLATSSKGIVANWGGSAAETHETSITVPIDGFLLITATTVLGRDNDETGTERKRLLNMIDVDGTDVLDRATRHEVDFSTAGTDFPYDESAHTTTAVAAVAAGTHTVTSEWTMPDPETGYLIYMDSQVLTVLFVPLDGSGVGPFGGPTSSSTSTGDTDEQ